MKCRSRLFIIPAVNQTCLEWGLWLTIKLLWLSYCLTAELQFLSACRLLACDKPRVGHLSLSLFYNSAFSSAALTTAVVKLQHGSLLSSINWCVNLISKILPGARHRAQSSKQFCLCVWQCFQLVIPMEPQCSSRCFHQSLSYRPHLLRSRMWDTCRELNPLSYSEDDSVKHVPMSIAHGEFLSDPPLLERCCSGTELLPCNELLPVLPGSSFSDHHELRWLTRIKAFCPGRHWGWMPLNEWVVTGTRPTAFCLLSVNYLTWLCNALFSSHFFPPHPEKKSLIGKGGEVPVLSSWRQFSHPAKK